MTHFETIDGREILPSLGNAPHQVIALTRKEQQDSRLLSLIAQRDPVHLARLLSLANGANSRRARPALNAQDAIDAIGVDVAYAAMKSVASASEAACRDDTGVIRQWMLRYSVNLALTTRRVAAAARLDGRRFSDVCIAALFDILGVHAALATRHPARDRLCEALRADAQASARWPREADYLRGYWQLSASIARRWGAGEGVAAAIVGAGTGGLEAAGSMDGALLWMCHELLGMRAWGDSGGLNLADLPAGVATTEVTRLAALRPIELAFFDA